MTSRLPLKLLLVFMAFFVLLVGPLSYYVIHGADAMHADMQREHSLSPQQNTAFGQYREAVVDNLVFLSFYAFVVAFCVTLVASRGFLAPLREVIGGMGRLLDGDLGVRLDITSADEMGTLTRSFNSVAGLLRKQGDQLHRRSQYIDAMLDPIWVVGDYNVITDVNPAFTRKFGYTRDEVIGSSVFDFLDEEGESLIRRRLYDLTPEGNPTYEISIVTKGAGLVPVLLSSSQLQDDDGSPAGTIGVMKDFRKETALRRELVEAREFSEAVMDSMVDQILIVDRECRILAANMAVRVHYGRDVAGESCARVLHGADEPCYLHGDICPARMVFDVGKPYRTIHEHVVPEGRKAFFDVQAFPVLDGAGNVRHTVMSLRDITDRMKFEAEIDTKNRELTALNTISRVLSQSLRSEDIFSQVIDGVIDLFGMDGGGIYLLDDMGRTLECRHQRGLSSEFLLKVGRLTLGHDLPGAVAVSGEAMIMDDVAVDPRAATSAFRHSGVNAFACVPIKGKEKLIGLYFLFSFSGHHFVRNDEGIFSSISEMMGISFENVRLYEKMRRLYEQDRKRRNEEQKDLLSLSNLLASSVDMGRVLTRSLALIKSACWADFVWLLESAPEGGLVMRAMSDGNPAATGVKPGAEIYAPGIDGIEARAIKTGEPVVATGIAAEGRYFMDGSVRHFASACAIPLPLGDRVFGAFTLFFIREAIINEEELHFLRIVGSVLAVALERARIHEGVAIQRGMADTVLESIGDAVAMVDSDGRIISLNPAAGELLGVEPSRTPGRMLEDLVGHSQENMAVRFRISEARETAAGGSSAGGEATYTRPDGSRRPLMVRGAPVRDMQGSIVGVVFVLRDLGLEREADELKTEFVRNVSHEFRTPLTAIIGMTEMVIDGELDPEREAEYLRVTLAEARRLSRMVSDVLDISRIESGREVLTMGPVNCMAMISDVKRSFEDEAAAHRLEFEGRVEGDMSAFVADQGRLVQLLRTLVENAVTYSGPGSRVLITFRRKGENVILAVEDTGWGIPEDELGRVCERFFRGRAAAASTKGSGLGLALAGRIVAMHGGSMGFTSVLGQGTTVKVTLPLAPTDRAGEGEADREA
jgi:PAS domain S-box-containing protein